MLLPEYIKKANKTDKFISDKNHLEYLISGLFGEAGGILAELKKLERDKETYSDFKERLLEEIGDFLWYFVRISSTVYPEILKLCSLKNKFRKIKSTGSIYIFLNFAQAVGNVISSMRSGHRTRIKDDLIELFSILSQIASISNISLENAAIKNIRKIQSRWPEKRKYHDLFDNNYPSEEKFPRKIIFDFKQIHSKKNRIVILKSNGLNIGDRLTDNIGVPDGYRFHDVFHFSYMVHLGWSPVSRSLLKCKRKSNPIVDEAEDGARASIIEEAISATVFSNAKKNNYYEGVTTLEYGLLKSIRTMVHGYEVSKVNLWQWEVAILDGFKVFRLLKQNGGGSASLDLQNRKFEYIQT
ncbi:nucleoside triphosphate pyrophosphohydrolase family protein [Leptospira santarosai]|uniref:nucleoside triphosphate pyrophosphohydrolase family protein n=1 Tax=Leptospira santarosai TaxID=28183 RepID=UPI000774DE48|nr:nucleoside triphosphate pyrophosphohydrolase family protein [Leptospira santarosai]